jgi:rsbT co-antagonist protein RsbR
MRTVERLELAAARLVHGDTSELVDLETRDELGQVARSFNQLATALLTASAHRTAIFAHAVDGIITLDEQQTVISCNPAAERLFGYASAEIVGQPVTRLMPGYCAQPDQSGASRREELGQRRDGSRCPLELALSEMLVGGQRLTMVIARDISERKQIEEGRAQLQQTIIQTQAATLEALATPLIPVTEQVVVMPLIGALDQRRVQQVIVALLNGVETHAAQVAILDITGVPAIDTAVAQGLIDAALAVRLLGASVVLTGIRPETAQALAALSLDLRAIVTRSTLQDGIAYALERELRPVVTRRRGGAVATQAAD